MHRSLRCLPAALILLAAVLLAACATPGPKMLDFDIVVANTSGKSLRGVEVTFPGMEPARGGVMVPRAWKRLGTHHGPWPQTAQVSWRMGHQQAGEPPNAGPVMIPALPASLQPGERPELRFEFDGEKVVPALRVVR